MSNNFGDKIKHFFGLEVDDQDYLDDEEQHEMRVERRREYHEAPPARESWEERPRSRVQTPPVATPKVAPKAPSYTERSEKLIICKYSPLDHRESTSIIDDIRAGRPVILNFEETDDFVAAKIINICEGAAYALDADISKIANEIFIVVPNGIDIMNNIAGNKDSGGEASF